MKHARRLRALLTTLGVALLLAPPLFFPRTDDRPLAARLLGPFANVAADWTWLASQSAQGRGDLNASVLWAERALALRAVEADDWERYANLVGVWAASSEREPDPVQRLALVQAALAIYARGLERVPAPAELAFARALYLHARAEVDPELPWPGGPREAWERAAVAYDAAAELGGPPLARALAQAARERAAQE